MPADQMLSGNASVEMAVYAGLIYEVIAGTNSSPQTTELNAQARGPTLMKWVRIGMAQGALLVALGVIVDKGKGRPIWPPLLGGGVAAGMMWWSYQHALTSGLANPGTPTEGY